MPGILAGRIPGVLQHPAARAMLANGGLIMAEQTTRMLTALVLSIWTARVLGPVGFGALSYALSFVSVFGVSATLGMNRLLVRELVTAGDDSDAMNRLVTTAFAMRFAAAAGAYVLCTGLAVALGDAHVGLVAVVAVGFFFSASDCVDLYFQAIGQAGRAAKARLISFLLVSLVRLGLLVIEADVIAFAAVAVMELAATALLLQLAWRSSGGRFRRSAVDASVAGRLLRESWPEIAAGFSGLLFVRIDQIMLEHFAGTAAIGSFAVAVRLAEAWYFVPVAIVAVTFPAIVAARASNEVVYLRQLQSLMLLLTLLSYATAAAGLLLAGPLVRGLLGEAFAGSAAAFSVLVWGGLFTSLGLVSGSWIVAEKRLRLNLWRNLAGLATNVLLNFLLIPRFGVQGAASATILSLALAYLLFDSFVPSMRPLAWCKWRALLILPALRRP